MAEYYNVTTNLGDAEIAAAITNNAKIQITHIAFGDGAGSVPIPSKTRTTLVREVHRQAVTKYERHPTNPNWIVIETIIPSDIGGFTIREMGIIGNGKLISHGSHAPFEKVADPSGVSEYRLKFTQNITDGNVVSITLDDSLIFATQAWVEENFIKRSEIVDNLTTDDSAKPVSAKQAKLLQDGKVNKTDTIALNHGGTGATNAAAARTNLGLGTAATQDTGTSQGQIMTVGSFGYGGSGSVVPQFTSQAPTINQILGQWDGAPPNGTTYGYGCGLNIRAFGYAAQIYFGAHSNTSGIPHYRASANSDMGRFYKFWTAQNAAANANGVLVPSSPIVQIHADDFILNEDAKALKAECVKLSTGTYEISNVDGFHQEGWYINTPIDKNQNPLVAVDYEFDVLQRKITIHSYAVKPGVFPFEPDLTQPMDAPEGRWIDVRLYEPEWLANPTLPPISETIKDKNGNTAPSVYHYLEDDEWLISEDNALILAQEKRSLLPKLSKRQFALYMYDHQMYDQVMYAIEANPRFKIEYDTVSDIERLSPTVASMTALLGWTDEQVDQMWTEALNL